VFSWTETLSHCDLCCTDTDGDSGVSTEPCAGSEAEAALTLMLDVSRDSGW
jgi:hypothetical protein